LRHQIEQLVPVAPFSIRDIGTHEQHEHANYVLLREYGQPYWFGMLRLRRRVRNNWESYFDSIESSYSRLPGRALRALERAWDLNNESQRAFACRGGTPYLEWLP
jgi:hypothetical protein